MSALRIAYVINSVEGGGAAQPVPAVASVLREAGAEVRVFALTPKDQRGLPAMIDAGLSPLVRQSGTKDHIAAARWIKAELTAWGATHIWTSLSRATILGLLMGPSMGLPVICWQHAAFLKPWNLRLLRALQSRAALWVGDSHSVTQLTAQRLHVEAERLHCWPIFAADPNMPQSQPWQAGEPVKISSLGRLHPVKGYDVLIEALSILQQSSDAPTVPFEITIAGDGEERARLENMAQAANITSVRFAGFTDKPRDLLRDSHLYLQPSRSEGFCIGAHEAMAAGLPVIASAVGELPHSIQDPSMGRVVPPNDAPALAKALASMLRNPEALHAAGQQARSTILERFSLEKFRANGRAIVAALQQRSA